MVCWNGRSGREIFKGFAFAHRSDEKRWAYISASRRDSFAIAKSKAWHKTCSSFSSKFDAKSVYFILRSLAGCSSSFSSLNFPICSSANFLRFHFSVSQIKALRSRTEASRLSCDKLFFRGLITPALFSSIAIFSGLLPIFFLSLSPAQTESLIAC